MRLPAQRPKKEGRSTSKEPERLSQRWAIILTSATTVGVALGITVEAPAGFACAVAVAGLLHKIMK